MKTKRIRYSEGAEKKMNRPFFTTLGYMVLWALLLALLFVVLYLLAKPFNFQISEGILR